VRPPLFVPKAPTISTAMAGANNFTLLRLLLAVAVVVSHTFSVTTGAVMDEPLAAWTGFTLGEHAVNGFFVVSGFLVTMSFDQRGWRDYVIARALRIAPGLIVATLVVALLLGGALTSLSPTAYLESPDLRRFIGLTLTGFKSNIALPGVFAENPFKFPMGTVWTLKYEVLCYAGVLAFGVVSLLRSRAVSLALVAGLALSLLALDLLRPGAAKSLETSLRLPLIFAFGGALYVWRNRARLSGPLALFLVAAAAAASGTFAYKTLLFVATSYGMMWLALAPVLTRRSYEPRADLSYGTYLYGWPVQQSLHALFPATAALVLLLPSLLVTAVLAAASWYGIEKPALALKARTLGRRTLKTIEPAAP
jgi:peptidoglycan/LPS O-acetylase OafA/YrhL